MKTFAEFSPTSLDPKGLGLPSKQDWLVLESCSRDRDSGPRVQSNFHMALKILGGEGPNVSVHRFGHWGPGWIEIILVRPEEWCEGRLVQTAAAKEAEDIEIALADYPVLDYVDCGEREQEEADTTWRTCYRDKQRIDYIRDHRKDFSFRSFAELLGCARGKRFMGNTSMMLD